MVGCHDNDGILREAELLHPDEDLAQFGIDVLDNAVVLGFVAFAVLIVVGPNPAERLQLDRPVTLRGHREIFAAVSDVVGCGGKYG